MATLREVLQAKGLHGSWSIARVYAVARRNRK